MSLAMYQYQQSGRSCLSQEHGQHACILTDAICVDQVTVLCDRRPQPGR